MVSVKRVYDEPGGDDGRRVLVDRLWPRGVRKDRVDEWLRDIAPSTELRKWYDHDRARYDEFRARYEAELAEPPAAEALATLRGYAAAGPVTLVTATRDLELAHTAVLADLLG